MCTRVYIICVRKFKILLHISPCCVDCPSICFFNVAFSRNGLQDTPKTTLQKRYVTNSNSVLSMSAYHRKRKASRSELWIDIIKNAFSISDVSAIGYSLNLIRISATVFNKHGPSYKQLFNETPR